MTLKWNDDWERSISNKISSYEYLLLVENLLLATLFNCGSIGVVLYDAVETALRRD